MEPGSESKIITQSLHLPVRDDTIRKLDEYVALLRKWNSRINLIASNEWSLVELLLKEALWASKIYPQKATNHLDIGSGAGFPAIPLKIVLPHICLDMVDSRYKRVSFLETVANNLKLPEIHVCHSRVDRFLANNSDSWDCISWKALKLTTEDFLALIRHAHADTQFWIFHGIELAVEDPNVLETELKLCTREKFPYKDDWALSIYRLR
ncbi:MAG: class I SAM-dependent methyltransferase [Acidobacteriota bacterium]